MRPNFCELIHSSLRGRVCFMGLGNVDHGDDGFGVRLAEALARVGVPDVIIAGTAPEQYIGRCADAGFDHLVFLDSVDFDAEAGSVVFLDSQQISARFSDTSTHKISLGLLAKYVENGGTTRTWLLGAQPGSLKPAPALSPPVQSALSVLADLLDNIVNQGIAT